MIFPRACTQYYVISEKLNFDDLWIFLKWPFQMLSLDLMKLILNQIFNYSSLVPVGLEECEELTQNELFEEKLIEAIDGLTQKSAQGRTSCLESVGNSLTMKYIPDFVVNRCVQSTHFQTDFNSVLD